MAKRGSELREEMLLAAKEVFLDAGFERASMDVIAARAGTTKRTLYAHFENKEKLFLAVVELLRELLLGRLKTPADYSEDIEEALVQFCGRFLEIIVWDRRVRMFRLSVAEAERFPDGAAKLYEAMFGTAEERLAAFVRARLALTPMAAENVARELLGRALYPRFLRALFGLGAPPDGQPERDAPRPGPDLDRIRIAVADVIQRNTGRRAPG